METITAPINAAGLKVAVVVSRFNESVTEKLLAGAIDALLEHGVEEKLITLAKVPGAHEIPVVAKAFARKNYDVIVALGCVARGETAHFDYVAGECCRGLTDVSLEFNVPIGNGVLTVENGEQAFARAGGAKGNKGAEAAVTALETWAVMQAIK